MINEDPHDSEVRFGGAAARSVVGDACSAEDKPDSLRENAVTAVKYDGMTYGQALSGFQSDLNPALQAKALDTLIQFAIRDHHAEEVAGILVQECRTFPLEYLLEITEKSKEGMLTTASRNDLEYTARIPRFS